MWLLLASPLFVHTLAGWVTLLIGAVYVVAAGVFLAAFYARADLTRGREGLSWGREALAWVAVWLGAVGLWAVVLAYGFDDIENSVSGWLFALWVGLCIGTPCYLAWQFVALAVRQFMKWRS